MEQARIGRYQILEEIATGGQATVYRAWDTRSGQVVALKVMHSHLARDASYLERFRRDAQLAASVRHPNVIHVFEVGQDGDSHFIAMEYLPLTVHDLVQAHGQLPIDRAVDICHQTAQAIGAASQRGIVHRDIKPHNILLAADGTVKVSDFGIARAAELNTMTRTGALMGTPHYMAPEQGKGQRADTRSDLYALGIVLYQMLTGVVPFDAETPWEVIRLHVESQPKRVRQVRSDVPQWLDRVVSRCMEKDPGRRYQTPQELAESLKQGLPKAESPRRQSQAAAPAQRAMPSQPPRDEEAAARRDRRPEPAAASRPRARRRRSWLRKLVYGAALTALATAAAVGVVVVVTEGRIGELPPIRLPGVVIGDTRAAETAPAQGLAATVSQNGAGTFPTPLPAPASQPVAQSAPVQATAGDASDRDGSAHCASAGVRACSRRDSV